MPAGVGHGHAAHQAVGIGQVQGGVGDQTQQQAVVEHPGIELAGRHGAGEVVEAAHARSEGAGLQRFEILHRIVGRVDDRDQAAVRRAQGRHLIFARPGLFGVQFVAEGLRPGDQGRAVGDLQGDGADRGAVQMMIIVGKAVGSGIEHDHGLALAVQGDVLAAVAADGGKAQRPQPAGQILPGRGIDGELDEGDLFDLRGWRWVGQVQAVGVRHQGPGLLLDQQQGTLGLQGALAVWRCTKLVVEHLDRQRPVVAGADRGGGETGNVQGALSRETTEVPADRADIHVQPGGIGQLQVEQFFRRDF